MTLWVGEVGSKDWLDGAQAEAVALPERGEAPQWRCIQTVRSSRFNEHEATSVPSQSP